MTDAKTRAAAIATVAALDTAFGFDPKKRLYMEDAITKAITAAEEAARREEREACAKVAVRECATWQGASGGHQAATRVVAAIRSRDPATPVPAKLDYDNGRPRIRGEWSAEPAPDALLEAAFTIDELTAFRACALRGAAYAGMAVEDATELFKPMFDVLVAARKP